MGDTPNHQVWQEKRRQKARAARDQRAGYIHTADTWGQGRGRGQGAGGRGRTSERQFQKERVRNPETREENSSRKRSTVRDFFCSNLCDRCDKSLEVVRDKGEPSQETQNLASRESLERRLSLSF